MTPERWQLVKDIFDGALEHGPESRLASSGGADWPLCRNATASATVCIDIDRSSGC